VLLPLFTEMTYYLLLKIFVLLMWFSELMIHKQVN